MKLSVIEYLSHRCPTRKTMHFSFFVCLFLPLTSGLTIVSGNFSIHWGYNSQTTKCILVFPSLCPAPILVYLVFPVSSLLFGGWPFFSRAQRMSTLDLKLIEEGMGCWAVQIHCSKGFTFCSCYHWVVYGGQRQRLRDCSRIWNLYQERWKQKETTQDTEQQDLSYCFQNPKALKTQCT